MTRWFAPLLLTLLTAWSSSAQSKDGNRLTYLDRCDPYYVSRDFPRLTTPQWIGEKGVDTVVILAIDDMREHKRYEAFLRPILERLKKIDGRAPVSIMTNRIDPSEPHLQRWLREGLSLETHTFDHPCPFFRSGKFEVAKTTYDRCVDLLARVPGSRPVAFRMPCCDSLNTPSPRFYAEIFAKRTKAGNYLAIDSSVFHLFTANDPELPRNLVLFPDGSERFRRYLPKDRTFVNLIEDYPYPYVIGRHCWQFPCMVPSDWEAQHHHGRNNPLTVRDWQAALDATVIKQGVFCLVFHPHGWIRNDQIVDLIDYAAKRYGKRVKFLTFKEALDRINRHLLCGQPIREPETGADNGIRLLDVNNDGWLDVVIGNNRIRKTRIWQPEKQRWAETGFPIDLTTFSVFNKQRPGNIHHFGVLQKGGEASFLFRTPFSRGGWHFRKDRWVEDIGLVDVIEIKGKNVYTAMHTGADNGVRLHDVDGDGRCELVVGSPKHQGVFRWDEENRKWTILPFALPPGVTIVDNLGRDNGCRFVDLNEDGRDDIVFSNEDRYGVYLFDSMKTGWSRKAAAGKRSDKDALPMIARQGTDMGFFVRQRTLWWSNETTPLLKDHVARRTFNEILKDVTPRPKSPEASLRSMRPRPGFTVQLMAAEPLVQDPIAFAWGADGRLWVVEMGDYPLGIDGKGKHGGNIKVLSDEDGDGRFDRAVLFLSGLGYPTGVLPWKKGALVTCAPEIFYAEDSDGDGRADRKEVLYTGFREGNQQHRVNSLVWGLDNWIYVANGDSGGTIRSVKTGKTVAIGGRDLRIRPWNGDLQAVSGQTQFGRSKNDWNDWFGGNNSNPVWHYVLEDRYLRRSRHFAPPSLRRQIARQPGAAPVFPISRPLPRFNNPQSLNHFTSACSPVVYRDLLFGPGFAGNIFISEPVHNLVHRKVLKRQGTSFTAYRAPDEQRSEFLASSDNWFRPTMIGTGPDGGLWIADMYRFVIEHPQWIPSEWQRKLDLRAGADRGRIYRVLPVGLEPRAVPRFDRLSAVELVRLFESPNGAVRDMAQMQLVTRGQDEAAPALRTMVARNGSPLARVHALCTLDGLGRLDDATLAVALGDRHPQVRRHAVRLCERRKTLIQSIQQALTAMLDDPDPIVRLQLAYSLGEIDWSKAAEVLGKLLAKDGGDVYLRAAALSSIRKENAEAVILSYLSASAESRSSDTLLPGLLDMSRRMGLQSVAVRLLERITRASRGDWQPWQYKALAGLLRNDGSKQIVRAAPADVKQRIEAMLAAAGKDAFDAKRPLAIRLAAVQLIAVDANSRDRLVELVDIREPGLIQRVAIERLVESADRKAVDALLGKWKKLTPSLRTVLLDALLSRREGPRWLLDAVETKEVGALEIDAVRRQRLLQDPAVEVRRRAESLLRSEATVNRKQVVAAWKGVLGMRGDPRRGSLVFKKHCAACHRLGDLGQAVGPDLAPLAAKPKAQLLLSILDPNQAVEARYLAYLALTKDGKTYAGLLAEETTTSLKIVSADGKKHTILRDDLEQLIASGKSAMPEGLEKDLSKQDMADLLAFLQSFGKRAHPLQSSRIPDSVPCCGLIAGNDAVPTSDVTDDRRMDSTAR